MSRAAPYEARGYRFSYDMLGERAKTAADAGALFRSVQAAIEAIGDAEARLAAISHALMARPSVSVKLSAIHPRFEPGKEARLDARAAAAAGASWPPPRARHGIGLTVDAEEQDRLDLTLGLFAGAFCDPALDGWPGLGLAVQAYGKRARPCCSWLQRLSQLQRKPIPVRLVKGAYWDSRDQVGAGARARPTTPCSRARCTRTCPISPACASCCPIRPRSFRSSPRTTPSRSPPVYVAAGRSVFEFQRLHGMGEALYEEVVGRRQARRTLPRLRAGRTARGPRGLPGATPARERRQHLVRQPPGRRGGADRGDHPRSRRERGAREGRSRPGCLPRPPEIYAPERVNSCRFGAERAVRARAAAAAGDRGRAGALLRGRPHRRRPDIDRARTASSWC